MSILGRERDFETLEFGLQFSLGGLVDERQGSDILAALLELLVAKTFFVFNKGNPASRNDSFSSHKVYAV